MNAQSKTNSKRPAYILSFIDEVNKMLCLKQIDDESDNLFVFACHYLVKKNMYKGVNYFTLKEHEVNGKTMQVKHMVGDVKAMNRFLQLF